MIEDIAADKEPDQAKQMAIDIDALIMQVREAGEALEVGARGRSVGREDEAVVLLPWLDLVPGEESDSAALLGRRALHALVLSSLALLIVIRGFVSSLAQILVRWLIHDGFSSSRSLMGVIPLAQMHARCPILKMGKQPSHCALIIIYKKRPFGPHSLSRGNVKDFSSLNQPPPLPSFGSRTTVVPNITAVSLRMSMKYDNQSFLGQLHQAFR